MAVLIANSGALGGSCCCSDVLFVAESTGETERRVRSCRIVLSWFRAAEVESPRGCQDSTSCSSRKRCCGGVVEQHTISIVVKKI